MKKQSGNAEDASSQLGFELVCPPAEPACNSKAFETTTSQPIFTASIVDLTPAIHRRAAEEDRELLKAVQTRAAHLSDCLLKRS
jgi:hypothetical protein